MLNNWQEIPVYGFKILLFYFIKDLVSHFVLL